MRASRVISRGVAGAGRRVGRGGRVAGDRLTRALGGEQRTRVIVLLACVLGLSGADTATVGAAATELRQGLDISNTDIGLLVAVTSLVAAAASLPFGMLADRMRRTWTLGGAITLWGAGMLWSAAAANFDALLLARVFLGAVTAAAGPLVASLVGDYFPAAERGRIYGYILTGELLGAGFGFAVTGDIAALSWRAAFVVLAIPAFILAWLVARLPEPARGGRDALASAVAAGRNRLRSSARRSGAGAPEGHPLETDAQRLARELDITADPELVLGADARGMNIVSAVRYVLRVRSNVVLIAASACGYFFLAGLQTFGLEFSKSQFGIDQGLATLMLLVVGIGAVGGTLAGGIVGDELLRLGRLNGRILASAVSATAATVLFLPALLTRSVGTALLFLTAAAFALSAQNPALDAARLDIMPAFLWGRAEAIRSFLRNLAQSLAPLLFGVMSDHVFGGGRSALQWTFVVMLIPLAASAVFLYRALSSYPRDVATAAAAYRPPEPLRPAADPSGEGTGETAPR